VQLATGPGAAACWLAAHHILHAQQTAPGRLDLQDIGTPLREPLLGVKLGFRLLDLDIDPGPPLPRSAASHFPRPSEFMPPYVYFPGR